MSDTAWQGRFLRIETEGTWEYAARANGTEAVVIVAIDEGHVLLLDQYRVPMGCRCIELPAGLVGDEKAGEEVATAAIRELEEETGYRAGGIEPLGVFCSSPGLTNERFALVRAHDLVRTGDGGGEESEDIIVHRVPLAEVPAFVATKRAEGLAVDVKLLLLLAGTLLGYSAAC